MRVCFFISGFDYSGAEIVLDRYIDNSKKNIEPYFIFIYENKWIEKKYVDTYGEKSVFSLNLKHNKNKLRFIPFIEINKIYKESKKYIDSIKPDVIYANNTHEMMLLKKVVENLNILNIAHIHDMRESISSPIKRYFMKKSINLYDTVITVSEATKKSWQNEKIKVVYNGVDESFYSKEEKYKSKINTIGFIGKISKRKGFDILSNIYEKNKVIKDKELIIVYSDIEKKQKINLDKLRKNSNIREFYKVDSNKIKEIYDEIDLLVVPSRQDPLPTVIIEAMARNCIVIGSNVDGIPELLGNEKLLFNSNDIDDLEKKIINIINLSEEELITISRDLRKRCENVFNNNKKNLEINSIIMNNN